jgi:hypothetical protein
MLPPDSPSYFQMSLQSTKDTAEIPKWNWRGEFVKYGDCAIGKGQQKNFNKTNNHKIEDMVRGHIFLDVALVQEH